MGFLIIALGAAAVVVVFAVMAIVALVVSLVGFLIYIIFAKVGMIIAATFGIILEAAIFLLFFSAYSSFSQIFWLMFFQEISLEKQEKKINAEETEAETKVPTPETV
jgi:amino acid permease